MNTRHRGICAGLAVALAFSVVPAQAAKYEIRWLLGHKNLDFFEEAAESFRKTVEKESHGDIKVRIVTADKQGSGGADGAALGIAAAVEKGEAEMGHSFTDVIAAVDPRFMAFEAPYLFRDSRHLEGVFEGPLGAEMLEGLRAHHMVGLSFTYSGGPSGIATIDRELRGPSDLKGLKVGVYGDDVNKAWLTALGAAPVAIEHRLESIEPLAREGKLDAVAITWRNFERTELDRRFKHMTMMGSTHLVSVTYVNDAFYDKLPAKYRELIARASRQLGRVERAKTLDLNERAKREMLAKGVRQVYLPEAGRRAFVAALAPVYERSIEAILGRELVERLRKTPDGPEHPVITSDFARR